MNRNVNIPRMNPIFKTNFKSENLGENFLLRKLRLKLKSLEDFWYCAFVTIVQLICIYRGCLTLDRFNSQSWQPFAKPTVEIATYAFSLSISIFLLPFFIWSCLLKIGSLANDNFKFGADFDSNALFKKFLRKQNFEFLTNESSRKQQIFTKNNKQSIYINLNQASFLKNSSSNSDSSITLNRKETKSDASAINDSDSISSKCATTRFLFKSLLSVKNFWKNFMPVASFIHLVIAFCLVYPDVLLTSKEIEYALRPKGGSIFYTRFKNRYNTIKIERIEIFFYIFKA